MRTTLIIIFIVFITVCKAQQADSIIISDAFRKAHHQGSLIYTDKLSSDIVPYMSKYFEKNKMGRGKTIRLTEKERTFILKELKKREEEIWPENYFRVSRRISIDSLYSIFNEEKHPDFVFSFMRPIYFRNNEYCLFYFSQHCGFECMKEEMIFLKLNDGVWKPDVVVFGTINK